MKQDKDSLKDFVDRHRPSFDDQKPDAEVLARLQKQLGLPLETEQKKTPVIYLRRYWLAAAAVAVLALGFWFILVPANEITQNTVAVADKVKILPKKALAPKDTLSLRVANPLGGNTMAAASHIAGLKTQPLAKKIKTAPVPKEGQLPLSDTASSGERLAAVLQVGKEPKLTSAMIAFLEKTINQDESTNLRLAALDILSRNRQNQQAHDVIIHSVARQDDPIVQVTLLEMLTTEESSLVKKQLVKISEDPTSIAPVRDGAYLALMRMEAKF